METNKEPQPEKDIYDLIEADHEAKFQPYELPLGCDTKQIVEGYTFPVGTTFEQVSNSSHWKVKQELRDMSLKMDQDLIFRSCHQPGCKKEAGNQKSRNPYIYAVCAFNEHTQKQGKVEKKRTNPTKSKLKVKGRGILFFLLWSFFFLEFL